MATNAYKGSSLVQRIYHGTAIEYNRHNWNKYSVATEAVQQSATSVAGNYIDQLKTVSLTGSAFMVPTGEQSGIRLVFPSDFDTLGAALDAGFKYVCSNSFIPIGDTYMELSQTPGEPTLVRITLRTVVDGGTRTDYVKGSTSYGVVQGYAGDYPNNGKQGNYWYEKVNA